MGNITASIYVGGGTLSAAAPDTMSDLKKSGFTTVIGFGLQVLSTGDLQFNSTTIVTGGTYVGSSSWPKALASLKQGETSVNRLLFSIGSSQPNFQNIQSLIKSQGTGHDSVLHRNFKALKEAIPALDGVDLDDELLYDPDVIVGLSLLLNRLGYQVTFCPYREQEFWIECLHRLDRQVPGLVSAFNLQMYDGGLGNNLSQWIAAIARKMGDGFDAPGLMSPGLWCVHLDSQTGTCTKVDASCPGQVAKRFSSWQSENRISSGFLWIYDQIQDCASSGECSGPMTTAAYASAMVNSLRGNGVAKELCAGEDEPARAASK